MLIHANSHDEFGLRKGFARGKLQQLCREDVTGAADGLQGQISQTGLLGAFAQATDDGVEPVRIVGVVVLLELGDQGLALNHLASCSHHDFE